MKVHVSRPSPLIEGSKHELMLEPETDNDRKTLHELIDNYDLIGCGIDAGNDTPLYVRIEISTPTQ